MNNRRLKGKGMDFGCIEDTLPNGLFGVAMTWILEILPFLHAHNLHPKWSIDTKQYGPLVPALIKPRKHNTISQNTIPLTSLKKKHSYRFSGKEFKLAHDLFFEYFDIADDILQAVETEKAKFGTRTLGVHYRGTDKFTEAEYISMDSVLENISSFLKDKDFDTIFVMSDEALFIRKMKAFPHRLVFTQAERTSTLEPVHLNGCNPLLAKEAMIDSLVLSKCDFVIKTSSCLSDWVKIWNPEIEVYNLNRYYSPWFPSAMIPVKSF